MRFVVGSSAQAISNHLLAALMIFSLTVAPWIIWRLRNIRVVHS